MLNFLAQAQPPALNVWNGDSGSGGLWTKIIIGFVVGIAIMVALLYAPTRARRPIVATVTFIAGLFYVLLYLWPSTPKAWPAEGEPPLSFSESTALWLKDAVSVVADFSNILTAFLLGLGIFSLVRLHLTRLAKQQKDWKFSLVLLISFLVMTGFGYWQFWFRSNPANAEKLMDQTTWPLGQYGHNLLFDGMFQQMEAAMFSIIAFFILSAAYRAFRIRSIESTILLATALIVMLSLMGAVEFLSSSAVESATGGNANSFLNNFKLKEMADWLQANVQVPSLRAVDFGISVGALGMGLRLWLSLEKGGASV